MKTEKIRLKKGKSKAFVFANLTRPNVFPCAEKLVELLLNHKIEVFMVPGAKEFVSSEFTFKDGRSSFLGNLPSNWFSSFSR